MDKRNAIEANEIDTAEVPEFVYESLARSLLPVIQKYYESDEGKRAFAEWKEKKDAEKSGTAGGLPCAAVLPFLCLPIFNFFDINNKSEPISYRIKVRIILHWWR